ncbi:MAG: DUF2868 domain-containing protein [Burkholderiaceae bacterium]
MAHSFDEHWLLETLRLRESLWGPLEDSAEAGRARAQGGDFSTRLLTRARLLARREQVDDNLAGWRQMARVVLLLFMIVALVAGGAAAAGALGSGGQSVNLAVAVTALLGLNAITFLIWVVSFFMQAGTSGSLLTNIWFRLTRRLARGPNAALLPRALLELLTRQGLSRWAAGVVSHGLWVLALLSMLATLLAMLATRRYTFLWETTLLSPDTFVQVVHALGWLPSLLGFAQPAADTIRASGGQQILPESAHALWSTWLLGVVVVYGLLPRVMALLLSVVIMRRRLKRLAVDPSLPGLAELHDRLMPASVNTGIDAAAAEPAATALSGLAEIPTGHGPHYLMGLELPPDQNWPPQPVPTGITDLGVIDSREERHRMLNTLRHHPAQSLLVCCDARQTPDRGTLALLKELASLAGEMRVALLPDNGLQARRPQWRQQLLQAGCTPEQMPADITSAYAWMETTAQAGAATSASSVVQPGRAANAPPGAPA